MVEAENDIDLMRKLSMTADEIVEVADAVAFAEDWNAVEIDPKIQRGVLSFDDETIRKHVRNKPDIWIEE